MPMQRKHPSVYGRALHTKMMVDFHFEIDFLVEARLRQKPAIKTYNFSFCCCQAIVNMNAFPSNGLHAICSEIHGGEWRQSVFYVIYVCMKIVRNSTPRISHDLFHVRFIKEIRFRRSNSNVQQLTFKTNQTTRPAIIFERPFSFCITSTAVCSFLMLLHTLPIYFGDRAMPGWMATNITNS